MQMCSNIIRGLTDVLDILKRTDLLNVLLKNPWGLLLTEPTDTIKVVLAFSYAIATIMLLLNVMELTVLVRYGWFSIKKLKKCRVYVSYSYTHDLPKVSIIIPVKGESLDVIEKCIENLFSLKYPRDKLEVIIVSDDEPKAFEALRQLVERARGLGLDIKAFRRERPRGFKAGAINDALRLCTGEVVAVMDVDTRLPPDYLLEAVSCLKSGCHIVSAVWRGYYTIETRVAKLVKFMYDVFNEFFLRGRVLGGGLPAFSGNNLVIWRWALDGLGGFRECVGEDLDLVARARAMGLRLCLLKSDVLCEVPRSYTALKRQFGRWLFNGIWNLRVNLRLIMKSRHMSRYEKLDFILWCLQFPCLALVPISLVTTAVLFALGVVVPSMELLISSSISSALMGIFALEALIVARRLGYDVTQSIRLMANSGLLMMLLSIQMLIDLLKALYAKTWEWIPTPKGFRVVKEEASGLVPEITALVLATLTLPLLTCRPLAFLYALGILALLVYALNLVRR